MMVVVVVVVPVPEAHWPVTRLVRPGRLTGAGPRVPKQSRLVRVESSDKRAQPETRG